MLHNKSPSFAKNLILCITNRTKYIMDVYSLLTKASFIITIPLHSPIK